MNIFFVSLGCDKNLVDSEVMLGLLDAKGYQIVDDETQADVMVINTCCFIHDAKEESIQTILDMARYKEEGRLKALVVTGCLAQRYKQEIIDEIPEVDVVLGTTSYDKIVEAVEEALEGKSEVELADIDALPLPETKRLVTTGGHYAYLKIAEGCDKHCTYCIIPKVRGNYRSVPMERLIKEAQELADQGVKELILVAQETTVYGQDIYGEKSLHKLLKELCQIKGIRWIRVLYCYPEEIYDELIQTMAESKKICHHLHLPLQSGSSRVLKEMNRRYDKEKYLELVNKIRKAIPDISLTTDIMVGFPGETEEDFQETLDVVRKANYDTAFTFIYSKRSGTPAAGMENQVPEDVVKDRFSRLLSLVQEKGRENSSRFQGSVQEVLVEDENREKGTLTGRTQHNLLVHFPGEKDLIGKYVKVSLDTCKGFYYFGHIVEE
mgnify:CR=1 FL=1